ncbi:MAG: GNAT family N-acetyltransferase [Fimbriimonas sp.]
MEVRPLEKADLPTVRTLLGGLIRQHAEAEPRILREIEALDPFANGDYPEETLRLVAHENGKVYGFAQGSIERAPVHPALQERRFFALYDLVVDPEMRRRGVATQLLEACFEWVRAQGVSDFELNVFAFNEEAIAFYKRHGFRVQRLRMSRELPL